MPRARVEKITELPNEYEIEIYISYLRDGNRVRVTVPKPVTKAKALQALQEALDNSPPPGDKRLTAYWEGFEFTVGLK